MLKVLTVFGTRPEAIKMAPVVRALVAQSTRIDSRICVTGQHREMLDQVLTLFDITPDIDLALMREAQHPSQVAAAVLQRMDEVLVVERPDWVLVQGDTTTAMATSLAAAHRRVRVGHVEAGLRTYDRRQPFPEEINRRITTVVAELHFAPTERARTNLLREGEAADRVLVTGNTVVDALHWAAGRPYDWSTGPLAEVPRDRRLVLVTVHRRENHGEPLERICAAVETLVMRHAGDVHVVLPIHPNPAVRDVVQARLGAVEGVTLTPPLEYLQLVQLLKHATLVLTDSGGLQEEAPGMGVPVLVLRNVTERPEGVCAGTARLVGTEVAVVTAEASRLLDDPGAHAAMVGIANPYGDGHAATRIVDALY